MKGKAKKWVQPFPFCLLPSAFCLCLLGCAHYEFDVVEPPEAAVRVGRDAWAGVVRGDIEYRLVSSDDRLVMHVHNRGESTLKLVGGDSVVVDPRGESHPIAGATILPGSFAKRVFPPQHPQVGTYGPTYAVGVGVGYGHGGHHHHHHHYPHYYHDPFFYGHSHYYDYGPRYYSVYDPSDRRYFEWSGESSVRIVLVYDRQGGEKFTHEFVVRRRRKV